MYKSEYDLSAYLSTLQEAQHRHLTKQSKAQDAIPISIKATSTKLNTLASWGLVRFSHYFEHHGALEITIYKLQAERHGLAIRLLHGVIETKSRQLQATRARLRAWQSATTDEARARELRSMRELPVVRACLAEREILASDAAYQSCVEKLVQAEQDFDRSVERLKKLDSEFAGKNPRAALHTLRGHLSRASTMLDDHLLAAPLDASIAEAGHASHRLVEALHAPLPERGLLDPYVALGSASQLTLQLARHKQAWTRSDSSSASTTGGVPACALSMLIACSLLQARTQPARAAIRGCASAADAYTCLSNDVWEPLPHYTPAARAVRHCTHLPSWAAIQDGETAPACCASPDETGLWWLVAPVQQPQPHADLGTAGMQVLWTPCCSCVAGQLGARLTVLDSGMLWTKRLAELAAQHPSEVHRSTDIKLCLCPAPGLDLPEDSPDLHRALAGTLVLLVRAPMLRSLQVQAGTLDDMQRKVSGLLEDERRVPGRLLRRWSVRMLGFDALWDLRQRISVATMLVQGAHEDAGALFDAMQSDGRPRHVSLPQPRVLKAFLNWVTMFVLGGEEVPAAEHRALRAFVEGLIMPRLHAVTFVAAGGGGAEVEPESTRARSLSARERVRVVTASSAAAAISTPQRAGAPAGSPSRSSVTSRLNSPSLSALPPPALGAATLPPPARARPRAGSSASEGSSESWQLPERSTAGVPVLLAGSQHPLAKKDERWRAVRRAAAATSPRELGVTEKMCADSFVDCSQLFAMPALLLTLLEQQLSPEAQLVMLRTAVTLLLAEREARMRAAQPEREPSAVAADDLLAMLSVALLRSGMRQPNAALAYMSNYGMTSAVGAEAYLLTTLLSTVAALCMRGTSASRSTPRMEPSPTPGSTEPGSPGDERTMGVDSGLQALPAAGMDGTLCADRRESAVSAGLDDAEEDMKFDDFGIDLKSDVPDREAVQALGQWLGKQDFMENAMNMFD